MSSQILRHKLIIDIGVHNIFVAYTGLITG